MVELIKELYESFMGACIRFFQNRFNKFDINEEFDWLKLQLEKERAEKVKLLNHILELTGPSNGNGIDPNELMDFKPVGNKGFVPWHVKQRELEEKSRTKARELNQEAKQAIEELEEELGIN